MLKDKVRTEAYRDAIDVTVKGKTVVDVGAGTGVLSVFAAMSGAQKVYAIENAGIIQTCRRIIKERNLE